MDASIDIVRRIVPATETEFRVADGPNWAQDSSLAIDFTTSLYYRVQPSQIICSRSTIGYADDLSGTWTQFAANTSRITNKGILVEESRTNVVLWCRDLTQAGSWTPTNITPLLNQTGIDGSANSASSITATAGNGTILQTTTIASSARWQSAFVKRLIGSGTINMTMDNGVTWTAISPTAAWQQLSIPTQTLANPQVGFQIVTNGDSIAVDFVQNENSGFFATSPILCTTVAGSRNIDSVTIGSPPTFGLLYSMYATGAPNSPVATTNNQTMLQLDNGGGSQRVVFRRQTTTGRVLYAAVGGTGWNTSPATVFNPGVLTKWAGASASGDQQAYFDGVAATPTSAASLPSQPNVIRIGINAGIEPWNGYIQRMAIWCVTRISNSYMAFITT